MTVPHTTHITTLPPLPPDAGPEAFAKEDEWTQILAVAPCSPTELANLRFAPRQKFLGTWFLEGDLGFIYGPRGLGKTWLAMHIARQIAEGGKVASWTAPVPRQVLYIDGEMPLDGLRERDRALSSSDNGRLIYLQHEVLFHTSGKVLNLADPAIQRAVSNVCDQKRVDVLFLDSLSCLFSGVKENDADAWDLVLPWLLDLRRKRVAVVFVAHAGRNGCMRGTSRREDAAFWILQLTAADNAENDGDGARFVCRFDKNRNALETECPPIEWTFRAGSDGGTEVLWKPDTGLEKFHYWLEAGLSSATDIAAEMGVSKGQVSKMAKQAKEEGWLRINGREYVLVPARPPTVFSAAEAAEVAFGRSKN